MQEEEYVRKIHFIFGVFLILFTAFVSTPSYSCDGHFEFSESLRRFSEGVDDFPSKYASLTHRERALLHTFIKLAPYKIYEVDIFMTEYLNLYAKISGQKKISYFDYNAKFKNRLENNMHVLMRKLARKLDLQGTLNNRFQVRLLESFRVTFRHVPSEPQFGDLNILEDSIVLAGEETLVNSKHMWAMLDGKLIHLRKSHYLFVAALFESPGETISRPQASSLLGIETEDNNRLGVEIKHVRKAFQDLDPNFERIETVYPTDNNVRKSIGFRWIK